MFKQTLAQAWRMSWRDWRAGELRFILLALAVAVAALTAVGFFVDRLRTGLERDAHQLLGADLLVSADQPVSQAWRAEARRRGLVLADTVTFPSMAQSVAGPDARAVLASVKAVSSGYPLRGRLTVSTDPQRASAALGEPTRDTPAPGTVWVDVNVLTALNARVGDALQLGERQFVVTRLIATEPDRGASFANFAPRVMLPLSDLEATGLTSFGARVTYRLQIAAPGEAQRAQLPLLHDWMRAQIRTGQARGVRIETLENGRPEMRGTLERAHRFLSLVGLLSAMLAALAVAMAARRFMTRHLDACAMLRCLGLTQNQVTLMYLAEFILLGLAGSLVGVLVGYGAHEVLLQVVGRLLGAELPPASWVPAAHGLAFGMVLLAGFALPPVLQLRNVPHNRVIRREQGAPRPMVLATYGTGLAAFSGLLLWQGNDLKLAALTGAGFLGGFALFVGVAWLLVRALRQARTLLPFPAWRFAITALQRRPAATAVQVVALALGLMSLLLLTVVRADLMQAWQRATPPDAPNRFIINILPEQKAAVEGRLAPVLKQAPQLYPMIRGRLVGINERAVTGASYQSEDARRLSDREFNLSATPTLPEGNEIVDGRWFGATAAPGGDGGTSAGAQVDQARAGGPAAQASAQGGSGTPSAGGLPPAAAEASVEQGIARTLGIRVGDVMRFDVGGMPVALRVTSLRKLEWGSMRANFFVILSPEAARGLPQTYMTAFRLPPEAAGLTHALARDFPNLSVIDVSGIVRQVQSVLDQVMLAVEFLFLFTLAAGVLVLYAALMGAQDERTREAALLRALGATRRQLSSAQRIEYALVGSVAGLLAASGAAALGWALATYQFKFPWSFSPDVWLAGLAVGVACALAGGWLGLRGVLRHPPLHSLRAA
jgi:putative ABC transport system permease protein